MESSLGELVWEVVCDVGSCVLRANVAFSGPPHLSRRLARGGAWQGGAWHGRARRRWVVWEVVGRLDLRGAGSYVKQTNHLRAGL